MKENLQRTKVECFNSGYHHIILDKTITSNTAEINLEKL